MVIGDLITEEGTEVSQKLKTGVEVMEDVG